ncbi:MAG: tRNA (adenosine(37)-N6)-dimethylallyltransferase MiaA [Leptospirillia bacterium]
MSAPERRAEQPSGYGSGGGGRGGNGEASPPLLCLTGPTAVGKTGISLDLAEALGAEIINADSRQIYRGMDIGTAKPTAEERARVPHHLIDVVDPSEVFSAARFMVLATEAIGNIRARGGVPLVVGGTGLYIRSLVDGIVDAPPAHPPLREALQAVGERQGADALHRMLQRLDPATAGGLHPNDGYKVIRAIEIVLRTGQTASGLRQAHGFPGVYNAVLIGLTRPRAELYERINRRVDEMIAAGWVDETEGLLKKGISPESPGMKAVGYRELVRFLMGEWPLSEAVASIKQASRNYAKRQFTWFRKDDRLCWFNAAGVSVAELLAHWQSKTSRE